MASSSSTTNTNPRSSGSSSPNSSSTGTSTKKKECYTFEPQQWRRGYCKNCFRTQIDHPTEPPSNNKGLSPRTSPLLSTKSGSNSNKESGSSNNSNSSGSTVMRKNETSPTNRRRPKSDEFKQKTPSPRESKRSLTSTSGRKSPSARSGNAGGSFSSQYRQSSTSSIDTKYVEELENDFFDLEDKFDEISKEKNELERELFDKERTIEDLQQDVEAYKTKILHFERRVQHLEDEIRTYRERLKLPESDQISSGDGGHDGISLGGIVSSGEHEEVLVENEQLRNKIEELEQLCHEVMEENEMLKEEQEEMQREIEEMHDHFQEDDTDTLRELKRDLETSNKNCRIFQFKLRKTERRYEQCENERGALEEKLNRLEAQLYNENDVNLIRGLEDELRMAKEVSVRLNSELDIVDEKRAYFEEDNKLLKEELKDSDLRRKNLEAELSKCRQEIENLKSMEPSGALQIPEAGSMRRSNKLESLSREPSFEEQSLQRELEAAKERETDLNEQLKYSEEEIHKLKRRLNDAEEENDSVSKKLESMMKARNFEETDYEDASTHALKIQVDLLEQENSTLRKKFVSIEQENLKLINDFRQLKSKGLSSGATIKTLEECLDNNYKSLEKKILELQSEVDRVEKENRRLNILNSLNQSQQTQQSGTTTSTTGGAGTTATSAANNCTTKQRGTTAGQISGSREMTTEFIQAAQLQEMKVECTRLKEQVRQYEKNIKNIMTQLEPKESDRKQGDIFKKYNEVVSNCREQERKIHQMRRSIDAAKEECAKYKDFYDKNNAKLTEKNKEKSSRSETKADLKNATKSVLLDEIVLLEEEIDELASKCEKAETKINDLSDTISEKEKIIDEMLQENERNEKELNQYIDHLLTKNALLTDLLNCVEIRANELQMQFDLTLSESADSCSDTTTTNTENSGLITGGAVQVNTVPTLVSAGSDDVFNEPTGFQINVPGNLNDAEKIKFRLSCMEKLLSEERKRTRIAEKQAEMALKDSAHSRVSEDSQLKKKEIEMLKSDLEEKNEMLEEKEQQIADLRTRLDQMRKMNEALRTLLDKQDETPTSYKSKEPMSKEQLIEINSYKKEIAALKSDIHQYVKKIAESEKSREKLSKEVRNLQTEMKIREEQFYEQDDEVRLKDQEIRSLKKIVEETQKSLKDKSNDSSNSDMKSKNEKINSLEKEVKELQNNNQGYKNQLDEMEIEIRQSQNEQKLLSDSIRTRDERIKEKDDIISHINQRLQNREKELNDFDTIIKQSNEKLLRTQEELKTTQSKLASTEIELASIKGKFEELQSTYDKMMGNMSSMKKDNEKLKSRVTELEKEKSSKPPLVPRAPMSSHNAPVDVDKLKSEISQLKKDKENLTQLLNKDNKGVRRDSNTSKNDSAEAYTRAIQQQQYVTRVNLLSDNVTRLNRQNIELKLQNESVQNEMLEYQRRFKNVKEQYDAEQESWVAERITLESRMKEHEDRKSAIISLRKSLQDASLKVADLEAQLNKEKQTSCMKLNDLEQSKLEIQKKLSQYEEQQKLPKVLQRFGGKVSTRNASESILDKEKTELKVRLETAEKSIAKLRTEMVEKEDKFSQEKIALIKKSEETRTQLDNLVQNLTNQIADMEGVKEQVYLLRERLYSMDESFERDRKIFNEERMCLMYRIEDSRMVIESWLEKVRQCENDDYKNSADVIEQLEKEIEKYLHSKDSVPYAQIRRRLQMANTGDSGHATPGYSSQLHLSSVPSSPGKFSNGSGKAASMDWTSAHIMASGGPLSSRYMTQSSYNSAVPQTTTNNDALSTSTQSLYPSRFGVQSFLRSNRSVSPETSSLSTYSTTTSTRKVTNYPDPTPGFLLHPSSRQSSMESLKEATDYSQRSFTLPGLRNNRNASRTSPARQKFFEPQSPSPDTLNPSSSAVPTLQTKPILQKPPMSDDKQSKTPSVSSITSLKTVDKCKETAPQSKNELSKKIDSSKNDSSKKIEFLKNDSSKKIDSSKSIDTSKNSNDNSKNDSSNKVGQSLTSNIKQENKESDKAKETTNESLDPSKLKPISKSSITTETNQPMKTTKSKSISIAPSIQQLRMKFAQKSSNNSSSFDK